MTNSSSALSGQTLSGIRYGVTRGQRDVSCPGHTEVVPGGAVVLLSPDAPRGSGHRVPQPPASPPGSQSRALRVSTLPGGPRPACAGLLAVSSHSPSP